MKGWIDRLNEAVAYIEAHLDDDISYEKAATIAGCSTYHFLRMFAYIADVPLSEYIRRRQLTKAAFDLRAGDKVLDVALRYGYGSPTAFNRAFRNLHGVTPSASRREGMALKAYFPITFVMSIQGAYGMEYRIETKPSFSVVGISFATGKESKESFSSIPKFWDKATRDGSLERICALIGKEPKGLLGICSGTDADHIEYAIAAASEGPGPAGLRTMSVPSATWAIFPGRGRMPDTIHALYRQVMSEWLPSSGYEFGDAPDIERYLSNGNSLNQEFEIWIPIVKKS
ncbi:MAG: AraC family transcriptional regulator [Bacteroidales bacterium]|nr:AraC family transcriptional regulator [Bacteroidales bacterium]